MANLKLVRVVAVTVVVLAGWIAYNQRIWLGAWFWHVKNHGVLKLAYYQIQVPKNWYVTDFTPGDKFLVRLDREPGTQGIRLPVTIAFRATPALVDVDNWASIETSTLKEKETDRVLRRDFNIDGEKMSCVGGEVVPRYPGSRETPLTWFCRSSGQLEVQITATQPDLQQIWDILSRITVAHP